jgi:hypothetical protein
MGLRAGTQEDPCSSWKVLACFLWPVPVVLAATSHCIRADAFLDTVTFSGVVFCFLPDHNPSLSNSKDQVRLVSFSSVPNRQFS